MSTERDEPREAGDVGYRRSGYGAPRRPNYPLHVGLLLATLGTTTWAGTVFVKPEVFADLGLALASLDQGLPFSLALMAILFCHEMGHYVAARRRGIDASLPYFLPIPLPLVGTMGAVIVMKDKIPSRNALVEFAAAGPLAGLVVAIPVLAYGIHLSPVQPLEGAGLIEGNSLLYLGIKLAVKGMILPGDGQDVMLHPTAWAGWVGLLVTMINLMPIGQLDGGHIAYAYFGERHNRHSAWLHRGLLGVSIIAWGYSFAELSAGRALGVAAVGAIQSGMPWLIWFGVLFVLRRLSRGVYHPPAGDDELTPGRRALCVAMMIIFALIFVPVPTRQSP